MKNKETKILVGAAIVVIGVCICSAIIVTGAVIFAGESLNQVAVLPSPTIASLPSEPPTKILPTNPPAPTDPPVPVSSPLPSNTPPPTLAPTLPPEPIPFTGQGDTILDVDFPGPGFVHIIGNSESNRFVVESYSEAGEINDHLVMTSLPYDGYRPIDWVGDRQTVRLNITAVGAWEITYYPLDLKYIRTLTIPGEYQGTGDDVLALVGANPDIATITGNAARENFTVIAHGEGVYDVLVLTYDQHQGSAIVPVKAQLLEIRATGPWTIQISAK